MESQYSPLKIAPFEDLGTGVRSLGDSWNMESERSSGGEGSASIGLSLELGCGSGYRQTMCLKTCGFTVLQLQELQLQALIYKYMEAGLPVPHHLVLPIWRSFASSLDSSHGGLYQLFPSFCGYGPLHLEYRNALDPEPGRCRRTDGKKWRCSKEAVPNHKYCERHMHRGRHRSRKLVEASQAATVTATDTASTNLSISLPIDSNSTSVFSPQSIQQLQAGNLKTHPYL
ncbi:hypothetical protein SLA2020_498520 [Shorea laevis]